MEEKSGVRRGRNGQGFPQVRPAAHGAVGEGEPFLVCGPQSYRSSFGSDWGGGRDFQDEMPMLYLAHSKEAWEVLSKGILTTHY